MPPKKKNSTRMERIRACRKRMSRYSLGRRKSLDTALNNFMR